MKKEEMTLQINEDLKHIPRTGRNIYDGQKDLRAHYNAGRRHDLKQSKSRKETIQTCVEYVLKSRRTWQPNFDWQYFGYSLMEWRLLGLRVKINQRIAELQQAPLSVTTISADAQGGILGASFGVQGADSFEIEARAKQIAIEDIGRFLDEISPKSIH